jgi:hypothetical protein
MVKGCLHNRFYDQPRIIRLGIPPLEAGRCAGPGGGRGERHARAAVGALAAASR